jgi:hypothetical protein
VDWPHVVRSSYSLLTCWIGGSLCDLSYMLVLSCLSLSLEWCRNFFPLVRGNFVPIIEVCSEEYLSIVPSGFEVICGHVPSV